MDKLVIAVDFDGTCVTHEYPKVGQEIGAADVLRELADAGHDMVLFTMRDGDRLKDAVNWFKWHSIPLYGINSNPGQRSWTSSPKVYADIYIDDSAAGCPVKYRDGVNRPFVDWERMRELLVNFGALV